MKKLFKTMTLTLILVFCMGMTVSARDYVISVINFDYDWYLQQHPELAAIFSADDHEAIWNFYQTTGEPAGWLGRRTQLSYYSKSVFDYDYFMENNPDVVAALGTDKDVLYDWFVTTGYAENRPARTIYESYNAHIKTYDIAEQITNSTMSDREKAKAAHDWICMNVVYDDYYNGSIKGRTNSVERAVFDGEANCGGYTYLFNSLISRMGGDAEAVYGTATNSAGQTVKRVWSRVKIDGEWLCVDVAWDDMAPDTPGVVSSYDYFLISESQMNQNHYPYDRYKKNS